MNTPAAPPIDPVTVATAIAALIFGSDLAHFVGPYAVILLGALAGGSWSATRRSADPAAPRLSTFAHMARMLVLSLLITVPLATVGARYLDAEINWLLGGVAILISGIGHDWPSVGAWAAGLVRAAIERTLGKRGEQ